MDLNYIKHLLILASVVTRYASIFASASLPGIPIGIACPAIGRKICEITARIKSYKSITRKKRKKHDKIYLFQKTKVNSIEVLIFRTLIDSYINRDKSVSVKDVLKNMVI